MLQWRVKLNYISFRSFNNTTNAFYHIYWCSAQFNLIYENEQSVHCGSDKKNQYKHNTMFIIWVPSIIWIIILLR